MTAEPDAPSGTVTEPARRMLRHTLATLAYRGRKAVRDAPCGFAHFRAAPSGGELPQGRHLAGRVGSG
jgi:hypothetical protein